MEELPNKDESILFKRLITRNKNHRDRQLEFYIWTVFALLPFLFKMWSWLPNKIDTNEFFKFAYYSILLSVLVILFPIVFNLIFSSFPFEFLRKYLLKTEWGNVDNYEEDENEEDSVSTDEFIEEIRIYSIEDTINDSLVISERIHKRSGVYILVGVFIAFAGIGLFYSPIFPITQESDLTLRFMSYLPRFSALFFVEFIAIYFLKQHRIMLEEYRYFEKIKRKRQDQYSFLKMLDHYKDSPEMLKIIIEKGMVAPDTMMVNGETTEILETHKIVNQDMDLLSKLADILRIAKQK